MEYFDFDGLSVSRIVLGTGDYGSSINEETSFKLLDYYVENGGNMIDTASVYGDWMEGVPKSASEKCVGKWLKQRNIVREKLFIATKAAHFSFDAPDVNRVRPECIREDLEHSFENVGVNFFDLYWLHRDDPTYPVEPIMDVLLEAVDAGKIGKLGASNWTKERITEANLYAEKRGKKGFVASQISCAYIESQTFGGVLETPDNTQTYFSKANGDDEYYARGNVYLFAYSSQANGYMSRVSSGQELPMSVRRRYDSLKNRERTKRADKVAKELGVQIEAVGLAYLLSRPFPIFPVIGPKNLKELSGSLVAADMRLTKEQIEELTVI